MAPQFEYNLPFLKHLHPASLCFHAAADSIGEDPNPSPLQSWMGITSFSALQIPRDIVQNCTFFNCSPQLQRWRIR